MSKYRKKPVVIETEQFDGETLIKGVYRRPQAENASIERPFVVTIHGQETFVKKGDWIVPEPDGVHYYPIDPAVFEATYEPVEDDV
jgi:hypothetical protein